MRPYFYCSDLGEILGQESFVRWQVRMSLEPGNSGFHVGARRDFLRK